MGYVTSGKILGELTRIILSVDIFCAKLPCNEQFIMQKFDVAAKATQIFLIDVVTTLRSDTDAVTIVPLSDTTTA